MSTLVISDVHERLDRLAVILSPARLERASEVVFLGDWFDTFKPFDETRVKQVCHFIIDSIDGLRHEGRVIPAQFRLGNHDAHYLFPNAGYICSGYQPRTKEIVNHLIGAETVRKFTVSGQVGPYLVSHAGYHQSTMVSKDDELNAIEYALGGGYDPLFGAGQARGGNQRFGGPTWLDWTWEFEHIPHIPQIVGHTQDKEARYRHAHNCPATPTVDAVCDCKPSVCLDTSNRHVAWVYDDDGLEIEEIS